MKKRDKRRLLEVLKTLHSRAQAVEQKHNRLVFLTQHLADRVSVLEDAANETFENRKKKDLN